MFNKIASYPAAAPDTRRYFWTFILLHVLAWTLGPSLMRGSLTHDTLEGIAWGLQWQWGYNKHPFLTAWLCATVSKLFGAHDWPIYLLAQIAVATTFYAVWRLAKEILPVGLALIACLCLEGVLFYNLNSFNLTPDSLQSPIWALLILSFYKALQTQRLLHWLLTGALAALAVVTKYQVALLFLPMLALLLINSQARKSFTQPGIYLAIVCMLFLLLPHFVWLFQHQFITLSYAFRTPAEYTHQHYAWPHVVYFLRYLANNIGNVLGLFILCWPFYQASREKLQINRFDWQFLLLLGLGPLCLSLALAFITGAHFPTRWSTPYFALTGILLLAWLRPKLDVKSLHRFILTLAIVGASIWLARFSSFMLGPKFEQQLKADSYQPNQQMAENLTKLWHDHYNRPLRYIAGSRYLVAALVAYSPDHPAPYFDWSPAESPWIDEDDVVKQGALMVWDHDAAYTWDAESQSHTQLTPAIIQRFPGLKVLGLLHYNRLTTTSASLTIGVALLAPTNRHDKD
jgi:4-amino-4-deoxy-L-arabinose transferase-like glycosyltransferase